MNSKGFTLIEMIVVLLVISFIMITITSIAIFFTRQVNLSRERTNMWSQLEYTVSDMRTRCVSAVTTITPLSPCGSITINGTSGSNFTFNGEADIYSITPDNITDNVNYTYSIQNDGALILQTTGGVTDVLIDGKYNPELIFEHHCEVVGGVTIPDEPHFIRVNLTLENVSFGLNASREDAIRFWFLDVVQ
ncbi:MAG: prepilin-type N-terminal cleavage/methylation domain-containing protein [Candidatus Omnitrophica bacterium]|nr:prepilin-type N-terminal cleavage/methylation domain-containing protein [Candidatus Omnitrophota bacterium]